MELKTALSCALLLLFPEMFAILPASEALSCFKCRSSGLTVNHCKNQTNLVSRTCPNQQYLCLKVIGNHTSEGPFVEIDCTIYSSCDSFATGMTNIKSFHPKKDCKICIKDYCNGYKKNCASLRFHDISTLISIQLVVMMICCYSI